MSMVINLVEDHNIYLCEGGPVYNGGVQPTPITYLTQWKIVGNSEVHTLPYPDGVVLPTGYKRCEYLQNEGSAYIVLPFGFNKTDEIYAKIASVTTVGNGRNFIIPSVLNDNNNRFSFGFSGKTIEGETTYLFCISYGGVITVFFQPYINTDTDIHEWRYSNYIYSIGNSSINVENFNFGGETTALKLFTSAAICKIYEYRHKKGNTEYRLVPCLDSNDTPCMYDVINNQAYYNSAESGSFTYKLYPQPTEIWSCGEYNSTDGKYHILVQPQGGSIADIALDAPLRKVNDVADTIEFPSDTDGKALVTRKFYQENITKYSWSFSKYSKRMYCNIPTLKPSSPNIAANILFPTYPTLTNNQSVLRIYGIAVNNNDVCIYDENYYSESMINAFKEHISGLELLYELATPTTELVDAPQIEESESYSCIISQGGKAVEWSSFETE